MKKSTLFFPQSCKPALSLPHQNTVGYLILRTE